MNQAVGVLIVDEPEGLATTLRAVLEHHPILQTVSEADLVGSEASEAPAGSVALVYVAPEGGEAGILRVRHLKEGRPSLTVLVAFEVLDSDILCRLINAGADAFVARNTQPRLVCGTIIALAGLETPEPVWETDADAGTQGAGDDLTPREAEILRFLSAGFSNKEVARRLNLSVRTVETHRLNLRRKTQTGRLKDLVALARQLGLAPVVEAEPRRPAGEPRCRRMPGLEAASRHCA